MQIPSNLPPASGIGTTNVNTSKQTIKAQEPPQAKGDTVQLSSKAKARLLKQNGASNSSIAAQMGLDIKTVNGYFSGATTSTSKPAGSAPEATANTPAKVQVGEQGKK